MQVLLPAISKANTQESVADVQESGLFSDASHLEDGGLMSQSPSLYLHAGKGSHKEGEGKLNREIKGGG